MIDKKKILKEWGGKHLFLKGVAFLKNKNDQKQFKISNDNGVSYE